MTFFVSKRGLGLVAVLFIVSLVAFGCADGDSADLPDGAVAQVGETTITGEELDQRIAEIQDQLGDQVPTEDDGEAFQTFEQQVLDYMITVEVVSQKADEVGVQITDEDVQAKVDEVKAMFGGDQEAFEQAIAEQNLTEEQLRDNLREQELVSQMIEEVTADVEVTDEEIEQRYEENQEHYQVDESRKTRHILFSPGDMAEDPAAEITDEQWEAARQEAEQVRQQILDGADFAEMAREHSDDQGSAQQGGDLGNVTPGTMVPEFDETVFSIEVGNVSEPVRTQFGYHVIQVQQENPERVLELDEVRDAIRSEILDEKKSEGWEEWLAQSKEDLDVAVAEGLEYTTTTTTAEEPTETGAEDAEESEDPEDVEESDDSASQDDEETETTETTEGG